MLLCFVWVWSTYVFDLRELGSGDGLPAGHAGVVEIQYRGVGGMDELGYEHVEDCGEDMCRWI